MKICFATHNQNKFNEINSKPGNDFELISLHDLNVIDEIPETGSTLEENSLIKAEYIYLNFDTPVFSDDSGLEVDALQGAPGVFSARYAGFPKNDLKNLELLLDNMKGVKNRTARFKTVITLIIDGETHQFTGVVEGHIAHSPSGESGFGYDPIFIPKGHNITFAQMSMTKKNSMSHRSRAFDKLLAYLNIHY
ncbi:MAG: RdgB/HAM1 family non-canonical purine NTP pyrophosphatase [Cyclobacteriaceae bacterium]|nr:RdgB/HAM1 family non-canonical purine NTP pyrophosphatase [Cyclobacteriaceae bacterium]